MPQMQHLGPRCMAAAGSFLGCCCRAWKVAVACEGGGGGGCPRPFGAIRGGGGGCPGPLLSMSAALLPSMMLSS